jgi:hypothetical protein
MDVVVRQPRHVYNEHLVRRREPGAASARAVVGALDGGALPEMEPYTALPLPLVWASSAFAVPPPVNWNRIFRPLTSSLLARS